MLLQFKRMQCSVLFASTVRKQRVMGNTYVECILYFVYLLSSVMTVKAIIVKRSQAGWSWSQRNKVHQSVVTPGGVTILLEFYFYYYKTKALVMKNYDNHDRNLLFDCDDSRNSDAGRKVERYLPNLIGIIYHDFDEATIIGKSTSWKRWPLCLGQSFGQQSQYYHSVIITMNIVQFFGQHFFVKQVTIVWQLTITDDHLSAFGKVSGNNCQYYQGNDLMTIHGNIVYILWQLMINNDHLSALGKVSGNNCPEITACW